MRTRTGALALPAAAALMWVVPAARASTPPPTLSFTTPASAGAVLTTEQPQLSGTVSRPGGFIDTVAVTVSYSDTAPGRPQVSPPPQSQTYAPASPAPSFTWNDPVELDVNGTYTVSVSATTEDDTGAQSQQTAGRTFVIDAPPTAPTNVAAVPDNTQRTVKVSWSPSPEPDVIGYRVLRAGPGPSDPPKVAGTSTQAWLNDTQVATDPAGSYRYQVQAVRLNGAGTGDDLSAPSAVATASLTSPPKAAPPSPPPPTSLPGPAGATAPVPGAAGSAPAGAAATTPARLVLPAVTDPMSDYHALANQAQATTVTVPPPDPGFNQRLPYQPQTSRQAINLPTLSSQGELGASDASSSGRRRTVESIAGALLLAVLAMFALVLKRSADQADLLEALTPTADPAPPGPPSAASEDLHGLALTWPAEEVDEAEDDGAEPVSVPARPVAQVPASGPVSLQWDPPRRRLFGRLSDRSTAVGVALAAGADVVTPARPDPVPRPNPVPPPDPSPAVDLRPPEPAEVDIRWPTAAWAGDAGDDDLLAQDSLVWGDTDDEEPEAPAVDGVELPPLILRLQTTTAPGA